MSTTDTTPTPTQSMRWGPFYKGLENVGGVKVVQSTALADVELRMLEAVHLQGMMRISAPSGYGKSFSTARAAEACQKVHPELVIVWVELPGSTKGRGLAAALYKQITGLDAPTKASLADLRRWVAEELRKRSYLIICDEAQHVSVEAMHLLRWLYDAPGSNLTVVFAGMPKKDRPFPPEIQSRCITHIEIEPITDTDVVRLLREMHPLFDDMDARLIKAMNKRNALGEWRWWSKFLARAVLYHQLGTPITEEAAATWARGLGDARKRA